MSAWTNTWVKCKFIPKDLVDKICNDAILHISNIWYMNKNKSYESILKEWLNMHKEEYDYFVNDCGIPEEQMTEEYLTKKLNECISNGNLQLDGLNKVKEGKLTLEKYIRDLKLYKKIMNNPSCKYVKNTIWVRMPFEIFRYRHYSELYFDTGLRTIDNLLKYLEEGIQDSIYDFDVPSNEGTGLTKQLRERIINYYSQFGDNNFSVYFG